MINATDSDRRLAALKQSAAEATSADQLQQMLLDLSEILEHYVGADLRAEDLLAEASHVGKDLERLWKRRDALQPDASDADVAISGAESNLIARARVLRDRMISVIADVQTKWSEKNEAQVGSE